MDRFGLAEGYLAGTTTSKIAPGFWGANVMTLPGIGDQKNSHRRLWDCLSTIDPVEPSFEIDSTGNYFLRREVVQLVLPSVEPLLPLMASHLSEGCAFRNTAVIAKIDDDLAQGDKFIVSSRPAKDGMSNCLSPIIGERLQRSAWLRCHGFSCLHTVPLPPARPKAPRTREGDNGLSAGDQPVVRGAP